MAKASVSIRTDEIQAREKPTYREQQLGRRNLLGAHVAHPNNPRLSEYQHKRRDLLGRIAGLPIVAAAVPVAASAAEAEDPHHEWHRQLDGIRSFLADLPSCETEEEEDARDGVYHQEWLLVGQIMATPARTLADLKLQLQEAVKLVTENHSTYSDERDLRCFEAALATVETLQGRA